MTHLLHLFEPPAVPDDALTSVDAGAGSDPVRYGQLFHVPGEGDGYPRPADLASIDAEHAAYYNQVRTHLALCKDAPIGRVVHPNLVWTAPPLHPGYDFRKAQVLKSFWAAYIGRTSQGH